MSNHTSIWRYARGNAERDNQVPAAARVSQSGVRRTLRPNTTSYSTSLLPLNQLTPTLTITINGLVFVDLLYTCRSCIKSEQKNPLDYLYTNISSHQSCSSPCWISYISVTKTVVGSQIILRSLAFRYAWACPTYISTSSP